MAKIAAIVCRDSPCSTRSTRLNNAPSPEEIFYYIYAVLHTPSYRARYKEFLKVDFPRIPYPENCAAFRKRAAIGQELVAVHLLNDAATGNMFDPHAQFPVAGTGRVDALKFADGKVWINREQYFDNVPETAWNAFIQLGNFQFSPPGSPSASLARRRRIWYNTRYRKIMSTKNIFARDAVRVGTRAGGACCAARPRGRIRKQNKWNR